MTIYTNDIFKIAACPPSIRWVVMAVVVVHQALLGVIVLAAPLDRLLNCPIGRHLAVGGVGVGSADVAGSPVYLPDVLGEVPAVGVPGGILLDGQGAGGYGLGGVPGDEPEAGMGGTCAVAACNTADGCKAGWTTRGAVLPRRGEPPMGRRRINLQIAPVEEAVAGGDDAVFRHHLGGAAAQRSAQTGAAGSGGAVVVHGEVLPPPPAGGASRLCCGGVLHAWSSSTYNTPAGGKHRKK